MSVITCLTFSGVVPFENLNILETVARQLVFHSNQQLRMAVLQLLQNRCCLMEWRVFSYSVHYVKIRVSIQILIKNIKAPLASRDGESALMHRCCPSVRPFVCLSPKCIIMRFSQKLSSLELWSLLTSYTIFKEPIIGPLKFKMAEIRHLKNRESTTSQRKIVWFWWNLVHKCRFGTRWQSHDQIWEFLKFKMAEGGRFKTHFWP